MKYVEGLPAIRISLHDNFDFKMCGVRKLSGVWVTFRLLFGTFWFPPPTGGRIECFTQTLYIA